MTHTYIYNSLRERRKNLGITQRAVANFIGLESTDRISRWEKGLTYPHVTNLGKLCQLFKVSPEVLYPDLFGIAHIPSSISSENISVPLGTARHHIPPEILACKEL